VLWLVLLAVVSLSVVSAERLRTRVSTELKGGSTRVGWYFRSGQWLADVRTFSAACQFVMEGDQDAPGQDRAAVELAMPESETAPNPTSMVEAGAPPHIDS
jgi:hypothetical protein